MIDKANELFDKDDHDFSKHVKLVEDTTKLIETFMGLIAPFEGTTEDPNK
jgi:hypothetical protein